jgi:hypothetical protein
MLRFGLTLAATCGMLLAPQVAAQEPARFYVEGRLKAGFPEGEWNSQNEISRGFGAGINGQAWLTRYFGIYGGWETVSFTIRRQDLPSNLASQAIDSGFRAGILTPYARGPIGSFLYGGGVFNTTAFTLSDNRESLRTTSNRELGAEIGGGLTIPLGPVSALTPTLAYRTHRARFGGPGINETTVSYLMLLMGLRVNMER